MAGVGAGGCAQARRSTPSNGGAGVAGVGAGNVQRHALAVLFAVLAAALGAVAVAAFAGGGGGAARWLVGAAAVALALWLGSLAAGLIRHR